jgi:hypothetical protein
MARARYALRKDIAMTVPLDAAYADQLDAADDLAGFRQAFVHKEPERSISMATPWVAYRELLSIWSPI